MPMAFAPGVVNADLDNWWSLSRSASIDDYPESYLQLEAPPQSQKDARGIFYADNKRLYKRNRLCSMLLADYFLCAPVAFVCVSFVAFFSFVGNSRVKTPFFV